MTSVTGFMMLILFCRTCIDYWKCNGKIECPWLSPHDEANCSQQCPWSDDIPCDCNKPENMTCELKRTLNNVCYYKSCEFLVLFYVLKNIMNNVVNVTIVIKLNKVSFFSKYCLIVM